MGGKNYHPIFEKRIFNTHPLFVSFDRISEILESLYRISLHVQCLVHGDFDAFAISIDKLLVSISREVPGHVAAWKRDIFGIKLFCFVEVAVLRHSLVGRATVELLVGLSRSAQLLDPRFVDS
jgi:hypothetical protein